MNVKESIRVFREEKRRIDESPICHLVMTPFTGLGAGAGKGSRGFKGDEWFKERIKIFKENTLKSLQNQSNQFFVHWISFRPEEVKNSLTQGLFNYLCGAEWRTIFTFGGLPFWDDKFDRTEKKDLKKRLKDILPTFKETVGDAKYVYETILASDDMLHEDAVTEIQKQPFVEKGALVYWNGYLRDMDNDRLAEWNPPEGHLPPFYTIMYPADVFLDPKKHYEYIKDMKSHEDVIKLFECKSLSDGKYMVNTHGSNLSTTWMGYKHDALEKTQHDFIGKEFTDEAEKKRIISKFGVIE